MNTRRPIRIWLRTAVLTAACAVTVSMGVKAQSTGGTTPLALSPGAPAGSYSLSDFDSVNLFNGNLGFSLPLVKIAGRGGAAYTMTARIEQKWLVEKEPNPGHPNIYTPTPNWWNIEGFNTIFSMGRMDVRQAGSYQFSLLTGCGYVHNQTLTRLTFTAPDGTEYELRDQLTNGQPKVPNATSCFNGFNRGRVFVTADGSSATFTSDNDITDWPDAVDEPGNVPPSGILVTRDGTHYRIDGGLVSWLRDRNGNKLSFTYDVGRRLTSVVDSLNRQVNITYGAPGEYDAITLKGFGGAARTIKVYRNWLASSYLRSDFSLQTYHALFPELNGASSDVNFTAPVITAVELPNGQQYHFYYNSYGEVARVVLPTGGAMEYDYAAGLTDGASSGVLPTVNGNKHIYRRIIERRIYPDGGSGTGYASRMTYSRPESSTSNYGYVTADQYNSSSTLLGRSVHYFYGSALASLGQDTTEYPGWEDGREYQTTVYAADGTTSLRQVNNTFAQRASVSWWTGSSSQEPPNDPRLTETTTTLMDTNQVSRQTFGYDDSVPFNNQNNVKEYDFGSGSAGSLVRETRTTFVTSGTYTDLGLLSLPSQVSVYDSSGVERSRSSIEYDNYASDTNHAALLSRSNISGFDSSFGTSYGTRGNATGTTHYLLNSSGSVIGSVTSYAQYDIAGNAVNTIDARGYATTADFSDRFGVPDGEARNNSGATELGSQVSYAFPTLVTNAANHTVYTQYDFYLSRPVDVEDPNGIVYTGYYEDALDRPSKLIRAFNGGADTNGQTTFAYDDTNHVITSTSDQASYGDNVLKSQTLYDGLGRTIEKRQFEGGTNYIAVQTQYDVLGRAYKSSNPFRPWQSETAVWTTSGFDALGRVTSVTTPDNAVVTTAYSGNRVLVIDQADKKRISVSDGMGRLKEVWEVTGSDSATESVSFPNYSSIAAGYVSRYGYDVQDDLASVSQQVGTSGTTQTRSFVYDSLKRLSSANNPESGTVNYDYDANGNLLHKTDARSITTTYAYDSLNRVTSRSYSDSTPTVTYSYDPNIAYGKGRLSSVSSSVSTYSYSNYDELGRVIAASQTIGSQTYSMNYGYDLASHVVSMQYPSGHSVTNSYDSAARLQSFTGTIGDGFFRNYSTGISYASQGGLQQEQFGTSTAVYNQLAYNNRGQLTNILAGTGTTGAAAFNRGKIVNDYSTTDNNGNLKQQTVYVPNNDSNTSPASWYQQYSYDSLNRLTQVHEYTGNTSLDWQQMFAYDRFGNRTIDYNNTTNGIPRPQFDLETGTNRLYGPGDLNLSESSRSMRYDAAGNLWKDTSSGSAVSRVYDAENRMTSETTYNNVVSGSYSYDGDGRRVKRVVGGVETWQVYGVGGELIAEYSSSSAAAYPQKEYGYRNGQLLITAESGIALGVAPEGLEETSATGTSITLNWGAATGATNYVIERKDRNGSFAAVANTSSTSWSNTVGSGSAYLYRVCAANSSNVCNSSYSNIALGVAVTFTDDPLYGLSEVSNPSSATTIKAAHINELRAAVNAVRYLAVVDDASYSHPNPTPQVSLIYVEDVRELRTKLNEALTVLHLQTPPFTDPNLVGIHENSSTATPVKAIHIRELRDRLKTTIGSSCYKSIDQFVKDMYQGILQRQPSASELAAATASLESAQAQSASALISAAQNLGGTLFNSTEYTNFGTSNAQLVTDVYNGFLQRAPDTSGYNYWLDQLNNHNYPRASLITAFQVSGEFTENAKALCRTAAGGSTTGNVHWMIADQLGTPRVILDATGNLDKVSRHDYLPFGEELFAGVGGRATAQGYSASDGVRQHFTQKERDNETGLDYFGARYYGSTQGRFTSPDEFLNSGRIESPQSWNRYTYVLNNPLAFTDPTGFYEYADGTSDKDKKRFEGQLASARAQLDKIKARYGADSAEYKDSKRALDAYGAVGEKNGVTVGFGATSDHTPGETKGFFNADGTGRSITVTIDMSKNKADNLLMGTIAHEGSHVQDRADLVDAIIKNPEQADAISARLNITVGATETKAYTVQSVFAEFTYKNEQLTTSAGGTTTFRMEATQESAVIGGTNAAIWNPSWAGADVAKMRSQRSAAIAKGLSESSLYKDKLTKPILR